jgi:hypothetical protein
LRRWRKNIACEGESFSASDLLAKVLANEQQRRLAVALLLPACQRAVFAMRNCLLPAVGVS